MKHRLIVHGLLAVLIVAGNAWLDAQKRPDFSGHWVSMR